METKLEHVFSNRFRWQAHLLFWACYLAFYTVLDASFDDEYCQAFMVILCALPTKLLGTYLLLYFLIPKFIYPKKYIAFFFCFALFGLGLGFLERILIFWYYIPNFEPSYDTVTYPVTHLGKIIKHIIGIYTVAIAAAAIKLLKRNYHQEQIAKAFKEEKLDAELKFLKAQIHPHFLFNTLNNLYSLTLQNSSKSSEVVLKLSNLLDYMLYECNVREVPLSKEINQIQNFIDLEKLRYGERLEVSFTANGNFSNKRIPPLLLLPFIENAFKHGVSQEIENTFVSIDLSALADKVIFKVENTKTREKTSDSADYTKGIGLKNVRRRLDLLFDKKYDLQVFDEDETFLIVLRLTLH